jgi:hypothetical protein
MSIRVARQVHSSEEDRRLGSGPMVTSVETIPVDRREGVRRLLKAQRAAVAGVTDYDVAAAEAGRPISERAARAVFGEDLQKSDVQDSDITLDALTVVRSEYVGAGERGYWGTSVKKSFAATATVSISDIKDAITTAVAVGHPVIRPEDLALLDRRQIREEVLDALVKGGDFVSFGGAALLFKSDGGVEQFIDLNAPMLIAAGLDPEHVAERLRKALGAAAVGEPLRKSTRLTRSEVVESWRGLGPALTAAGIDLAKVLKKSLRGHGHQVSDQEARDLASRIDDGRRRVECNDSRTACVVR